MKHSINTEEVSHSNPVPPIPASFLFYALQVQVLSDTLLRLQGIRSLEITELNPKDAHSDFLIVYGV